MLKWNLSNSHHHKVQSCAPSCHSPYYHSLMSDWIYDDSLGNQIHKKPSLACYFPWKQLETISRLKIWLPELPGCVDAKQWGNAEERKMIPFSHYTGLTASINLKSLLKIKTKDKNPPLRLMKHFNHFSIKYNQEKPPLTTNVHRIFPSYSTPSWLHGSHLVPSFKIHLSCKYKLFHVQFFPINEFPLSA